MGLPDYHTQEYGSDACWPPGMRSELLSSFMRRGSERCQAAQHAGSVVLSLMMPREQPLTASELCGETPVAGFFDARSGVQLPMHGTPSYQRAKVIVYLWAHLAFALWHGYEVVVVHGTGSLPKAFTAAHGASACVHFVEAEARIQAKLGLFSARYHNALSGMAAHPTQFVIHEDLDTDFGPQIVPPFFQSATRGPAADHGSPHTQTACPAVPVHGRRCAPCAKGSPDLFLAVSDPLPTYRPTDPLPTSYRPTDLPTRYRPIDLPTYRPADPLPTYRPTDPFRIGKATSGREVLDEGFHSFVQTQMDACFGRGTKQNMSYNTRRFELWFSGQLGGASTAVQSILHRAARLLEKVPAISQSPARTREMSR